jgi:SAM-dependent methyltransferase
LPFDSNAFDCVVLADVLEHLNNPHAALDEAMRVARSAVVVLLPNVLTLLLRLRILAGHLPAKYKFGPHASLDRHRWIMNFDQAAEFTRRRAELNGWTVTREYAYTLPWRRFSARIAYALARRVWGPNVWAWEYVARLEPDG